jgi:hypothetical protein
MNLQLHQARKKGEIKGQSAHIAAASHHGVTGSDALPWVTL